MNYSKALEIIYEHELLSYGTKFEAMNYLIVLLFFLVQGKAIPALLDFAREIGMQVAPNKINNHTFMKELKASHVNSLVRNVLCNKSQNFT
jgi:hypothetical protein